MNLASGQILSKISNCFCLLLCITVCLFCVSYISLLLGRFGFWRFHIDWALNTKCIILSCQKLDNQVNICIKLTTHHRSDTHTEGIREPHLRLLDTFVSLTCLFFGTHHIHRQLIQLESNGRLYCAEHCSSEELSNFLMQCNFFMHAQKKFSIWVQICLELCVQFCFNPFLLIKNKWLFISSEGFATFEKTPWYVIRGQCCPSSQVWQPSADSNASLTPFLFEFKLSGSGVTALCWQKWCTKRPLLSAEGCHTRPDHSAEYCRGQERTKGRKGSLMPDFQANTRPRIFKKPMSPQDTGTQLWGNPGIVSLKVHKREKFCSSDFEFFTILYLVKHKY